MQRILRKLGIFTILIQIFLQIGFTVFAGNPTTPASPAEGANTVTIPNEAPTRLYEIFANDEKCIDEKNGDNKKYITIIEEPLNFSKQPDREGFEVRTCYRNTLIYSSKNTNRAYPISDLLKKCSPAAQEVAMESSNESIAFSCREVQVYLSSGGKTLLFNVIRTFYFWGGGVAGIIAVAVIVFSGIQISASGGSSDASSEAKKRIIRSLSALALLFLSGLLLNTINPNFFVT